MATQDVNLGSHFSSSGKRPDYIVVFQKPFPLLMMLKVSPKSDAQLIDTLKLKVFDIIARTILLKKMKYNDLSHHTP